MGEKHILVVDDNGNILNTLEMILMSGGHRVTTAMSKWEAMRKIEAALAADDPVDMIITDIQLPIESGFSLMDDLEEHHINIPFIFITGFLSSEYERELSRREYVRCLEKPISMVELLEIAGAETPSHDSYEL